MESQQKKSFWALLVTQFFGAFNDNLLKFLITLLVVGWIEDIQKRNLLVSAAGAIFVAPFLMFSMIAGRIACRVGKPSVIRGTKIWELIVISAAILSLLQASIPWMMVMLFMLSMQATFFSPAKYGILPEMMPDNELPMANAFLNLSTFVAILLGTVTAGYFSEKIIWACAIMGAASLAGLVVSFWITPIPASKPDEELAFNPFLDLIANWRIIRVDRPLRLGTITINYFWFMAAIFQLNIFLYAKDLMHVSDKMASLMCVSLAFGIGLGCFLCAKLSHGESKISHVLGGAFGMSLLAMDFIWAQHSMVRVFVDLFLLGAAGGFYYIPLMALLQARSPKAERGRIMATINFLSFVAILAASGVLWLLSNPMHKDPAQVFFTIGAISLVVTTIVALTHHRRFFPQTQKTPGV